MNKIKIGERDYYYKFSKAAVIEFEKETGKSLAKQTDEITLEEQVKLCWIAMKHGCKAEGVVFDMTFEQFIDNDTKYDVVDEMTVALTAQPGK